MTNHLKLMAIGFFVAAKSPGEMIVNVLNNVKEWLLAGAVVFAVVQFIIGALSFMSKEPQKQSAGKDHMLHACMGVVACFSAGAIMSYLQTQASSWSTIIVPTLQRLALSLPPRS